MDTFRIPLSFLRKDTIFGDTKICQRTCGEKVYDKTKYQTQLRQHGHFCAIKFEHVLKRYAKKRWYLRKSKKYIADAAPRKNKRT